MFFANSLTLLGTHITCAITGLDLTQLRSGLILFNKVEKPVLNRVKQT